MYDWRKMTPQQREEALRFRRQSRAPWHSPPHFQFEGPRFFHLTAACYEHVPILGRAPKRMAEFEEDLLAAVREGDGEVHAWCVLPNHWHALAKTRDLKAAIGCVGRVHGRASRSWNLEDACPGRKCWHACADRRIRGDGHFWATLNYVHHNPVHHGYVEQWQDWPFSSAAEYLRQVGEEEAKRRWEAYPVLEYGRGWDEPGM